MNPNVKAAKTILAVLVELLLLGIVTAGVCVGIANNPEHHTASMSLIESYP